MLRCNISKIKWYDWQTEWGKVKDEWKYSDGHWGTVCDDQWDINNFFISDVICKMPNYSPPLSHFKKMVLVWKTKSLLFCFRYDPLIVFPRQNHVTFIFLKMMSHDLLVQMACSVWQFNWTQTCLIWCVTLFSKENSEFSYMCNSDLVYWADGKTV